MIANDQLDHEQALDEVIAAYLTAVRTGEPQDPQQWQVRYPELSAELAEFFADRARLDSLTKPLRDVLATPRVASSPDDSTVFEPRVTASGQFGDYELLEEIGRGGMGVVYKAHQKLPRRIVALKMIRAGHLASPADVERFHAEAEAAAGLDHPHIVPIYEVGQHAGQHYFTMKLIDGGNLAEILARSASEGNRPGGNDEAPAEPFSNPKCEIGAPTFVGHPKSAAKLLAAIARAVHYAHQRGILHRDLKPSNILLDAEGQPYVSDFGLAKRFEGDSSLTGSGAIVGTASYMAPEQASGAKTLTTAADIYSLGAILYELLTDRPPFRGASPLETIMALRDREPAPPRALNPKIDRDLETICLKCLDKDPQRRYASAAALADDFDRWLAGEPIAARPLTRPERLYRWARRQPAIASLTLAILFIAFLGLFGVFNQWQLAIASEQRAVANEQKAEANAAAAQEKAKEANQERDEAQRQRDEVRALNEKLLATQKQLERMLYASNMNHAKLALDAGAANRARELLDKHRPQPGQHDERGFEWHYLDRLSRAIVLRIAPSAGNAVFSPDGKWIAGSANVWLQPSTPNSAKRVLRIWDAQNGQVVRTLDEREPSDATRISVAFSPDGKLLATGSHDSDKPAVPAEVRLLNSVSGDAVLTIPTTSGVNAIAFSPDSSRLAAALNDNTARIWDLATGREVLEMKHGGYVNCLAFNPDGRRLATGVGHQEKDAVCEVEVWNATTGQREMTLKGHGTWDIANVAFSPDGKRLATSAWDGMIKIWDAQSGSEVQAVNAHGLSAVAFSPDGLHLASSSSQNALKIWDLETGIESITLRAEANAGPMRSITYSPDGKRLLTAGRGLITVWDAEISEANLIRGQYVGGPLAYSTDGQRIATANGDTATIWDVASRKQLLTFKHLEVRSGESNGGGVYALAFSPDGKHFATSGWRGWDEKNDKTLGGDLRIWNAQSGQLIHDLSAEIRSADFLAFSPDGKRLATSLETSEGHLVRIWNVESGKRVLDFKGHDRGVNRLAFTPDGRRILSTALNAKKRAILWDAQTGNEILALELPQFAGRVVGVAFTPQGDRFALAAANKILVFNAQTGAQLLELSAHTNGLNHVAFSTDAARLLTAALDGAVSFWDAANGQEVLTLTPWDRGQPTVAFSPNGQQVAVSIYGAVKILDGSAVPPRTYPPPSSRRGRPIAEGWQISDRALPKGYEIGLDDSVRHGGAKSAFVKSTTDERNGGLAATQQIAAQDFRGKRVRFSGYVKTEQSTGRAFLIMGVQSEAKSVAHDNMLPDRPITGTTDWTKHEIVLDVPPESVSIMLGFFCGDGIGQAWFDDLHLEVVGNDVPTTKPLSEPPYVYSSKNIAPEQTAPINLDFEK